VFGSVAGVCSVVAVALAVRLAVTYSQTGLVPRLPTAILATGLTRLGLLLLATGLILDSAAKARVEAKRLAYLRLPTGRIVEE
jgi:hypothetical protein